MQCLNRIELVGFARSLSKEPFGELLAARFSVVTQRAYKDRLGEDIVEDTWIRCQALMKPDDASYGLQEGDAVRVVGRLRIVKTVDADGTVNTRPGVLVSEIGILEEAPEPERIEA